MFTFGPLFWERRSHINDRVKTDSMLRNFKLAQELVAVLLDNSLPDYAVRDEFFIDADPWVRAKDMKFTYNQEPLSSLAEFCIRKNLSLWPYLNLTKIKASAEYKQDVKQNLRWWKFWVLTYFNVAMHLKWSEKVISK